MLVELPTYVYVYTDYIPFERLLILLKYFNYKTTIFLSIVKCNKKNYKAYSRVNIKWTLMQIPLAVYLLHKIDISDKFVITFYTQHKIKLISLKFHLYPERKVNNKDLCKGVVGHMLYTDRTAYNLKRLKF